MSYPPEHLEKLEPLELWSWKANVIRKREYVNYIAVENVIGNDVMYLIFCRA